MAGKSQIPGKYSPNRGSSSIRKLFVLYVTDQLLITFSGGISLAYGDDRNGSDEPQWASPATLIPGRIKQFSGFATPRPSLLPPGASLMYASIWANWSAWSFCANGVRIRVRACNTIKGFRCTGHNQETRPCEDIEVRPFDPSKSEFRNVIGGDYDVNDPWAEDRLEAMRQLMPSSPTKKIEAGNLHESLSNIEQDPSIVDSELSPSQNQLEKIRRALSGDGDEVVKAATLSLLKKEIRRKMRRRKMGSRVFKPKHGRLQLAAPVFVGSKINTSTSNSTESHEATTANIILPSTPLGIDEILNLKTINLTEQTKSDKKNDGVEGSSTTTQATSITQPSTLSTSPLLNSTGKSIENESTTAIFFPPISPWKPSAIAAITDMETFLKGIIRGNHEDENSSNERSSTESISTSKETTTKATTTETTTATEATTTTKATTTTTRNPLEFQTIPLPAGAEIDADESQSITKKLLKLGIVQTSSSSSKEHIGTSGEPTEIVFPTRKGLKLKTPALTTTLPTTRAIQTLATPATVLKTTSRIDALEEMKQLIAKAKTHKKKPFLKTVQSVRGEVISRIKPKRKGTLHWGEVTIKPAR
ncbi:hypothetical protein WR25_18048 isoform D [Diploscapter pachys]|uniref:Uncharacterized protein n=1 Tax=Diploscapter pachys TaxID=2018661 RepID=A0A2A2JE93_9BILA|nr:hypothetical protein WR25_18048 isoform A [Diploscapter pachys]PAV59984.1 hypothetical protein WR25_18048 isoform B [Diploscapter pachys]PAV59985.1 hypothetical protein WR25_18048 isoform C [Diploscapter pachys]PAV59986.1 hypothetical protein WR25_18048 isoform D [Diploscapter pachys]